MQCGVGRILKELAFNLVDLVDLHEGVFGVVARGKNHQSSPARHTDGAVESILKEDLENIGDIRRCLDDRRGLELDVDLRRQTWFK